MKNCFSLLVILNCIIFATITKAGDYSDEYGGVYYTNLFQEWIAGYTEYIQPDTNSGGYCKNDAGGNTTNINEAIVGKPSDFTMSGTTKHVFSLGNRSQITLTFDLAICNNAGMDFAVFENGFTDNTSWEGTSREGATNSFFFAELAFVEVASETSHWAGFSATYGSAEYLYELNNVGNNWFCSQDVTEINNLAGKHYIAYGTPFDLDELTNHSAVIAGDVNLGEINFIRLTDAVGDGNSFDKDNNPIYDPYYNYLTGYPNQGAVSKNNGFDLRGIGVLNCVPEANSFYLFLLGISSLLALKRFK